MKMKVPNLSGNSFSTEQNYDDQSDDYEDVLESEEERGPNDFSEFLWMENEDQFETEVYASLEEQELVNECLEAMAEMSLLDEIKELQAEDFIDCLIDVQNSKLNPDAQPFIMPSN